MQKNRTVSIKFATNLVLGVLVMSVGALCLSPIHENVATEGASADVYRSAENGEGVSLMFNVYWGTEEVYRILDILHEYDAKATFFIGVVVCIEVINSFTIDVNNNIVFF